MQWRALKYFDMVARCRSLRQAAARLHIAPTAIGRQVEMLEHRLGAPLVERGPEGIRLTAAGELFAEQARRTLRDLERVEARIADLRGLHTGRVSIEAAEGVVAGVLVPALAGLGRDYPGLEFDVTIASASGVIEALRSGDTDVGLAFFLPPRDDIVRVATAVLEHCVVLAPTHPLAQSERLTLSEALAFPMALPDDSFGVRQALSRATSSLGVRCRPQVTTASLETQKALAIAGAALLILPAMAVERECRLQQLVTVPLHPGELEQARMDLCVYRHRTPSLAVEACLERLRLGLGELDIDAGGGSA